MAISRIFLVALALACIAGAMAQDCPPTRDCRCKPGAVVEYFTDESGCRMCRCVLDGDAPVTTTTASTPAPTTTSTAAATRPTTRTDTAPTRPAPTTTTDAPRPTTGTPEELPATTEEPVETPASTTTTQEATRTSSAEATPTSATASPCPVPRVCRCKPNAMAVYSTDASGCRTCSCVAADTAATDTSPAPTTTTTAAPASTTSPSSTTLTTTTRGPVHTTTTTFAAPPASTTTDSVVCRPYRQCRCKPGAVSIVVVDSDGCNSCSCVLAEHVPSTPVSRTTTPPISTTTMRATVPATTTTGRPHVDNAVDVAFALDGSDSISHDEFTQQLMAVARTVVSLPTDTDRVRIAVFIYSAQETFAFDFDDFSSRNDIVRAVLSLTQPGGSQTDLASALDFARLHVFVPNAGFRFGAARLVVFTDGAAGDAVAAAEAAAALRVAGINVFVELAEGEGMTEEDLDTLVAIANAPASFYLQSAREFQDLADFEAVRLLADRLVTPAANDGDASDHATDLPATTEVDERSIVIATGAPAQDGKTTKTSDGSAGVSGVVAGLAAGVALVCLVVVVVIATVVRRRRALKSKGDLEWDPVHGAH